MTSINNDWPSTQSSFMTSIMKICLSKVQIKDYQLQQNLALLINGTPSGEGLGLRVSFPSRSKVQHLIGANNLLGPHPLVKS